MRKRIFGGILFLMIFVLFSVDFIGGTAVDWAGMSDEEFTTKFEGDPAGVFAADPARAWQTIEANPSLMANPAVSEAAFDNNVVKAVEVINNNPTLMENSKVLSRFNSEAICLPKQCTLLNDNPETKKAWLKQKFQITDEGATIGSYDGKNIKTAGDKGTTFTAKDFPDATVKADGSLVIKKEFIFSGTDNLYKDEKGLIHMEKGEASPSINYLGDNLDIVVKGGKVVTQVEDWKTGKKKIGEKRIIYEGSFDLSINLLETKVSGKPFLRTVEALGEVRIGDEMKEAHMVRKAMISGEILDPAGSRLREFIIIGNPEVTENPTVNFIEGADGTELRIEGMKKNDKIYYTEYIEKSKDFCGEGYSCVINAFDTAEGSHELLRFHSVEKGNKIFFESPYHYAQVEVDNINDGEIDYSSLSKTGKEESGIKVSSEDKRPKIRGTLAKTNAGKFDIFFSEKGKDMRTHYSITDFQKKEVMSYFEKARKEESFVTCEIGKCEKAFAEAFGEIVGPKGKIPETTIIIAGDNVETTKSLEEYCKKEGCYILNSRDAPSRTTSKNLVVTGHHYELTDYIWRDSPEATSDHHIPIDQLKFSDFPEGPIESITFSACNTVVEPSIFNEIRYNGITGLMEKYKSSLEIIQGWDGKALLIEHLEGPATPEEGIRYYRWGRGERGGTRASYIYKTGEWYWTDGRKEEKVKIES